MYQLKIHEDQDLNSFELAKQFSLNLQGRIT